MQINLHNDNAVPASHNGSYPPSPEQLRELGFREFPVKPTPPEGMVEVSCTKVDVDGVVGAWNIVYRTVAEVEAEERAAKSARLTPALRALASLYRSKMVSRFGVGAERNRDIDEKYVQNYWVDKLARHDMSTVDHDDLKILQDGFEILKEVTGTDEVWSIFEQYGEIP